jgi:predicted phage replisome organizer
MRRIGVGGTLTDVKWIKITTSMFDDEKIRVIESMPEADSILVIWVKLLCLAGKVNDNGCIYLTKEIPYIPETIANVFNRPLNTVKLAMETFKHFGMIEYDEHGFLFLPNWEKHQNIVGLEEIRHQNQLRQQKRRALLALSRDCHVTSHRNHATELDLEVEVDKEKEESKTHTPLSPKKKAKVRVYSPAFLDFWKIYPRKQEKGSAWRAWNARLKEGATSDQLILAARHYALSVVGKDQAVMKLPATLLGPGQGPGGADPIWQEWQEPRANGDGRKEESKHERPKGDYGFRPYGYGADASDYEK